MKLGWKVLIPVALVWTLAVAVVRQLRINEDLDSRTVLIAVGIALAALLVLLFWPEGKSSPEEEPAEQRPFDAFAAGYPVPPMPGQSLPVAASRMTVPGSATPAEVGSSTARTDDPLEENRA
jgi:NADH-quinone oxidoreductase subunit H